MTTYGSAHIPSDLTCNGRDWLEFSNGGEFLPHGVDAVPEQPGEPGASDAAISFLQRFHPASLWALASFGPGENEVGPARTFDPSEAEAAQRFINELQGKRNIYYSVNRVSRKLGKKAAKAAIAEIHYLHVDADLNKALTWSDLDAVEAEKASVLAQLRAYNPVPTAIVWSGGGFQAFWRLSEIIVVNGDPELMAPVERRMQRIAKVLGADACHNADRIMRLPGTLNVLGKTKIRAGRKPALAELIEFHEDRIYDLEDFPEPEAQSVESDGASARRSASHDADEFDRARDALRAIPADDYDPYLRIGMALKSGFGDAGFALYREWAMSSIKFNDANLGKKWESIRPEGGITIATLFGMARDQGWQEQQRSYSNSNSQGETGKESGGAEQGSDAAKPDMSIVRRNQMPAAPFPLDVLRSAADWVQTTAESKSAPIDYVALGLLVTAGGLIGPKRRVSPWDGWDEPCILWGALVGPPSFSKSPAIDPLRDAVRAVERGINSDWAERQARFETDKKVADARRAVWEQEVTTAVKSKKEAPQIPVEATAPKAPTRERVWIVDATTEKIARLLGENAAGLLCFRDELAGLLGGFDKYGGSGSDRAFWIEAYGGRSYRYDRVSLKDDAVDIPFCAVSLLGTLQPDRLNSMLLCGDDDGLVSRPLYAWPDPVPPRRPSRVPDRHTILAALQRLWSLGFDTGEGGTVQPRVILLEADAADEFQAWWERKQWDAKLAAGGRIAGAVGKLDGVALRLAQVLEFLEWAWCQSNTVEPEQVSLQSVRNAMRLIDDWVRPNLERVFAEASLPQPQRDAMTIGRWLLKHRHVKINARDLRRQAGFPGPKEAKELDAALEVLVDARWLINPHSDRPGRPRKDFIVNSAIYEGP